MTKPDPIMMTVNFADIINRMSDETLAIIAPHIMDDINHNECQKLAMLTLKLSPQIVGLLVDRVRTYTAAQDKDEES